MCLRVYLFGFTSECVAASRMSVLGCALLFYMCEYCKKKVCAAFSIPVCLCVCVNSPSSTFGAMQKASNAFHVSEPSVFVRVCVCVCVCEGERVRIRINTIDLFTLVPSIRGQLSPVYHLKH